MFTATEIWVLSVSDEEYQGMVEGLFNSQDDAMDAGDVLTEESGGESEWGPWTATNEGSIQRSHLTANEQITVKRQAVK